MKDELTQAIIAAGEELRKKHGWTMTGNSEFDATPPDGEFVSIVRKHILPLIEDINSKTLCEDGEEWKEPT